MSYIDSHCHLNFPQYHKDMEQVVADSFAAGIVKLINVGTDLTTSAESVNLASRYKNIFATVGVHPHDAKKLDDNVLNKLTKLATDKKVVAIGEIGLDYFRNLSAKPLQREALIKQLQLAVKLNKPIVIHCRDAYGDLLGILDEHYLPFIKDCLPGVVHCFAAGVNYLREFLKRGFYIGINGMVTYPNNQPLVEAVKLIPMDKLIIETDAPYLSPQAYRGQRNQPIYVIEVAKQIATIKQISQDRVADATTANTVRLFGLQ